MSLVDRNKGSCLVFFFEEKAFEDNIINVFFNLSRIVYPECLKHRS